MCGRFVVARERRELVEEFAVDHDRLPDELPADYNVAPTKDVCAVLAERARGEQVQDRGRADVRQLRLVRWGLVPSWSTGTAVGSRLINARAETVAVKPSFRSAFARRRCLIPADGFYEWHHVDAARRRRKQPYYIHPADGGMLALAGIYERWRDRAVPDDHPAAWLWTAAIITTSAEDRLGNIHDRMPMIVPPSRWQHWLDPDARDGEEVAAAMLPATAAELTVRAVSTEVNSVRSNGPQLVASLAGDADVSDAAVGEVGGRPPSVLFLGPGGPAAGYPGSRPRAGRLRRLAASAARRRRVVPWTP